MNARVLELRGPGRLALVDEPLPAPADGEMLVETLYSGISCYFKLANYHSATGASSVIHDRIVRGASAAAVSMTALEGVQ